MSVTQEQLEWIVREVVRRLRETQSGMAADQPSGNGRLAITDRLVTIATLRDQLDGITQLEVHCNAIVTPAAVDMLKEHQVKLVRVTATTKSKVS